MRTIKSTIKAKNKTANEALCWDKACQAWKTATRLYTEKAWTREEPSNGYVYIIRAVKDGVEQDLFDCVDFTGPYFGESKEIKVRFWEHFLGIGCDSTIEAISRGYSLTVKAIIECDSSLDRKKVEGLLKSALKNDKNAPIGLLEDGTWSIEQFLSFAHSIGAKTKASKENRDSNRIQRTKKKVASRQRDKRRKAKG